MELLVIIGIAILLYHLYKKYFKIVSTGSMVCVTGGVKSGKTTFSLWLALRKYRRNLIGVYLRNFLRKVLIKLFPKKLAHVEMEEKPLFYTVIPVKFPHVLLTDELILREERFAYKSVIWIDEASLFADSQAYKNHYVNRRLNLLNKLIAHETRGGAIVYNTQSIDDLHFSVRRCLSEVYYVHDTAKFIPFFLCSTVREERYCESGNITQYNEDVADSLKRVLIPKSIWKKFDCYCYSALTDEKRVHTDERTADTLKAKKIITLDISNKE